jgi:hypothetical protein
MSPTLPTNRGKQVYTHIHTYTRLHTHIHTLIHTHTYTHTTARHAPEGACACEEPARSRQLPLEVVAASYEVQERE